MRKAVSILVLLALSAPLQAQELRLPERSVNFDRKAVLLTAGLQLATIYDVETTFRALRSCAECYESNPIARNFTDSRVEAYAVSAVANASLVWASLELRKQKKWWWFVPLAVGTGIHFFAAEHNRGVVR